MLEVLEAVAVPGWVQKAVGVLVSSAASVKMATVVEEEGAGPPQQAVSEATDHWWATQMEQR